MTKMKRITSRIPGSIWAMLLIILVFWLLCKPGTFLTGDSAINIARQSSFLAIVSIGSLLVILTGGIDLSLGGVMCLSGVVTATLVKRMGMGMIPAVVIALAAGSLMGMLNGFIISRNRVAPFIITLATSLIAKSLALVISKSQTVSVNTDEFRALGGGTLGVIPYSVFIMIAVYAVFHYLTQHRAFGTYIYAIGGNENAAHLTGIQVEKVKLLVYTLGGFVAALAGIILASRLGSANPGQGEGYEFYGIASVVVGGASMAGGVGTVWRTLLGVLIISILRSGLNIAGLPNSLQMIVLGLVIVGVVIMDVLSRREKG